MMNKTMKTMVSAAFLAASITGAQAAPVTFDFTNFSNGLSVSFSSGGVNLTVDNTSGDAGTPVPLLNALGGLAASSDSSFAFADFTFSQDVQLVSYTVSNSEDDGDGAFFNLSQGGLSANNNAVDTVGGPFAFSNLIDVFSGGLAILFTTGDAASGGIGQNEFEAFALSSITVNTVSSVPVPAALPLFGTGLAALGFVGWRRKRKTA